MDPNFPLQLEFSGTKAIVPPKPKSEAPGNNTQEETNGTDTSKEEVPTTFQPTKTKSIRMYSERAKFIGSASGENTFLVLQRQVEGSALWDLVAAVLNGSCPNGTMAAASAAGIVHFLRK